MTEKLARPLRIALLSLAGAGLAAAAARLGPLFEGRTHSSSAVARERREPPSVIEAALFSCRAPLLMVAAFSALVNILTLSGSIYMLQIYDRVLSSRSIPTLIGLSALLLAAFILQGLLDAIRARMLARIGASFSAQVSPTAFAAAQHLPLLGLTQDQAMQPMRDLDHIRSFLASLGPTAFFDMPWMLLFLFGCFLLHPWLGALAVTGGIVILAITGLTERSSRRSVDTQAASSAQRRALAAASQRNAEVITALGMGPALRRRWHSADLQYLRDWLEGADVSSNASAVARMFRMALQSAVLGLGAYLAIRGEISGGSMIAASIMTSRALAPIEIAVANWKGFVAARQGLHRLRQVLNSFAQLDRYRTLLPRPCHHLMVDGLFVAAPGRPLPILQNVSFRLQAGQGVGIIGPSASGKSTLARTLVGVWRPQRGEVRIDGAALDQWQRHELGRHIGYLPQDVELFDGSIAENVARFMPDASDDGIIAAAKAAGAHDLIVSLPDGYDTRIGEGGASLSGGQRQRIGLARALYGDPFLVVLDEPNAHLDSDGDDALTLAIRRIRQRGGIVVVVTHRQAAIAGVDHIAMMAEGRIQAFGPKEAVLQKVLRQGGLTSIQRQAVGS